MAVRMTTRWEKIVLPAPRKQPRRQEASAVERRDGGLLLRSEFDGRSDDTRGWISSKAVRVPLRRLREQAQKGAEA
jgi:hypothetical protein